MEINMFFFNKMLALSVRTSFVVVAAALMTHN